MDKNKPNIILLKPGQRTSENVKGVARAVHLVATDKCEAPAQCCERTYEDFLSENISIFDSSYHFDWYLFPCHCETTKCLNFDPLENTHDAIFFLQFCQSFQEEPKYSEKQIGSAPDIRMAICKKAIDQWFNPECHETYWIRLLKILQHLDYTLRSLMILEAPETYQYFIFILKEICLPYFKDSDNDRYQNLYTYDANFHQNIAFFNYLSMEYLSAKSSSNPKISDEEEILTKVYQSIVSNIQYTKGNLKKDVFSLKRKSTNGKYVLDILDSRKKNSKKEKGIEKKNKKSTDSKKLAEENKGTEKNSVAGDKFKNDDERENNIETINFKDGETETQYIIKKIDGDIDEQQQNKSKYFLVLLKFLSCIAIIIAVIWPVLKVLFFPKLSIVFVIIPTPLLIIGGISLLVLVSYMQNKLHEKPKFGQTALNNILEHTKNHSKNNSQIQLENNLGKRHY